METNYYMNSYDHLLDELKRVALLIRVQVRLFRQNKNKDEFRGLYISDQEVDEVLSQPIGRWNFPKNLSLAKVRDALKRKKSKINAYTFESKSQGTVLNLIEMTRLFDLTSIDNDILLICLASELDDRYERVYAYLQDDMTKKQPTMGLVAKILSPFCENQLDIRARFLNDAPLVRHNIINLTDGPERQNSTVLNKFLKMDARLVNYLLGFNHVDTRIKPFVQHTSSQNCLAEIILPTDLKRKLEIIIDREKVQGEGFIFYFQGPLDVGKESTAQTLCKKLGKGILSVDGESLVDSKEVDFDKTLCLILREASLQGAVLFWRSFDVLLTEDKSVLLNRLLRRLEDRKTMAILSGNKLWEPKSTLQKCAFLRIEFPMPDYDQRLAIWNNVLKDHSHLLSGGVIREVADKFSLNRGQILAADSTARNLAYWRDPENRKLSWDDLNTACRLQSNLKLATLAQKITPLFKWTDLILPSDQLKQLQEICNHLKYRYVVYRQWGFEQKLSLGKGISVLFSGVPGTGKTMAAEILAREMGLDLYKIDLSRVVSKYIGETEKNLSRIFTEAETSNAILFFDEADALFGKRSEVKDAHDRYANIEIGYLLQKMEEYEGLTILATNLRQNMDEAFVRRMRFIVNFPFPDELHRYKIWNVHFPEEARCDTIDFEFLARQFKLAGGNIRNVVINAAFLAASNDIAISMEHLIHATKREFQKAGKACVKSDFGKYFEMIEDKVNQ